MTTPTFASPASAPATTPAVSSTARAVVEEDLAYMAMAAGEDLAQLEGGRLLITGGAGFLGYYLVQLPLYWNRIHPGRPPIAVVVVDNFLRGVPEWLENLREDRNLTLIEHDITRPLSAEVSRSVSHVIHAASVASPTFYRMHPIETMDANVSGLRRLLDLSVDRETEGEPISGFLFFSTSEIYGDPSPADIPTPESYRGNVSCTGPRACYDESKRYGETLCVNFARVHDLPVRIARPFNNYGPGLRMGDGRVLPDFARDVLSGRDIVMLSDGSPTRTFCYVADAVVGYYRILVRGRDGEAYNIGVERPEISILQLAERVVSIARDLFGYSGQVVRAVSSDPEYLVDNPNRRCPVLVKARSELGYAPAIDLDEGIRRSLLWYAGQQDH